MSNKSDAMIVDKITPNTDKPTVICRCWESSTFPFCDGTHRSIPNNTHGPLIISPPSDEHDS